jgi:hypothetical protein
MTPITRGAKYRDVSGKDTHGDVLRVSSVWIDEDGTTQINVFVENQAGRNIDDTVTYEDFTDSIDSKIIRTNTDHEAWKWRQDN